VNAKYTPSIYQYSDIDEFIFCEEDYQVSEK